MQAVFWGMMLIVKFDMNTTIKYVILFIYVNNKTGKYYLFEVVDHSMSMVYVIKHYFKQCSLKCIFSPAKKTTMEDVHSNTVSRNLFRSTATSRTSSDCPLPRAVCHTDRAVSSSSRIEPATTISSRPRTN